LISSDAVGASMTGREGAGAGIGAGREGAGVWAVVRGGGGSDSGRDFGVGRGRLEAVKDVGGCCGYL
jgi:hypothetical protein